MCTEHNAFVKSTTKVFSNLVAFSGKPNFNAPNGLYHLTKKHSSSLLVVQLCQVIKSHPLTSKLVSKTLSYMSATFYEHICSRLFRLKSHFILMKKLPRWAAACKKPKWYELHLFSSMDSVIKLMLAEFMCEKAANLFSMKTIVSALSSSHGSYK